MCIFQRHMETSPKFTAETERIQGVPVIDISSLVGNASDEEKHSTSMEIGKALRELGFLYVINHGVEQTLRDKMMEWCTRLVNQSSDRSIDQSTNQPTNQSVS